MKFKIPKDLEAMMELTLDAYGLDEKGKETFRSMINTFFYEGGLQSLKKMLAIMDLPDGERRLAIREMILEAEAREEEIHAKN